MESALKPKDVVVVMKLALSEQATYQALAASLDMSVSQVHSAVRRAIEAGLIRSDRKANRSALLEFLVHGVKYAFAARRGQITRGMPTAHAAPPLKDLIAPTAEPPPVWPDPDGAVRGEAFEPLWRAAPAAAKKDEKLYAALSLVDAIRGGRARERALAEEHLQRMLAA